MLSASEVLETTDPKEVECFAKQLIGKTFAQAAGIPDMSGTDSSYSNVMRKGGLGNLIEEKFFRYEANNNSEADFNKAGVELKTTPYEKTKTGEIRAGERLVLSMIAYNSPIDDNLFKSHFWEKNQLLLLIVYYRDKTLFSNLFYAIHYVSLFSPPPADLKIIEDDYRVIVGCIQAGKAHELSEGMTHYLGACTKGETAAKSWVPQFYGTHELARRRAFCYKQGYMTYVLNNYIVKGVETFESIVKCPEDLYKTNLENLVLSRISKYKGLTDIELAQRFGLSYTGNKAQWSTLTYHMLGVKSRGAAEFVKANIRLVAVRLEENGVNKESVSLPPIVLRGLYGQQWQGSDLQNYFEEKRFFFVVFRRVGRYYRLMGGQFWSMSFYDREEVVRKGWESIRDVVTKGIVLKKEVSDNGTITIRNNLPGQSDNPIIHVRPHASKRFYKLSTGEIIGDGNYSHAEELIDGQWMPKQSFWLNKDYVLGILKPELKTLD